MECKNKRYVADPFIASKAVNYPTGTDAVVTSEGDEISRKVVGKKGRKIGEKNDGEKARREI